MHQPKKWKKRFKLLTFSLIASVTINVGFVTAYLISVIQERKVQRVYEIKPLTLTSTENINLAVSIDNLSSLTFRELVCLLGSKENVEDGYLLRDVALACLVKYHHFNLGKALSDRLQKRVFLLSKGKDKEKILFFPALSDYQFDAISHYAYTEKWPLTSKGLFNLLQRWEGTVDKSLMQAFFHTKEFEWVENIFARYKIKIDTADLLQVLIEDDYAYLKNFIRKNKDIDELTRRKFLLEYIFRRSKTACHLLLETDFLFAVKKLDDPTIFLILSLLEPTSEDVEQFCFELIKSSRSDSIWKKSSAILYHIAKEQLPEPYDHNKVLKRFVYSDALKEKWSEEANKESISQSLFGDEISLYTVKEGDTLWNIARKFKVDIDQIIEHNQLASDRIHPGNQIEIPKQ